LPYSAETKSAEEEIDADLLRDLSRLPAMVVQVKLRCRRACLGADLVSDEPNALDGAAD
jgi:hypothetical protein